MSKTNDFTFDPNSSLRNHFLIAMPSLANSYFEQTVTYICDHNEHGAMGIVINQTMDVSFEEVLDQLNIQPGAHVQFPPILAGGPVNKEQGLIIHRNDGDWKSTLPITDTVCITASRDILEAMARGHKPSGAQMALGYAGWSAGQLEEEIAENSWLTYPADESILFDTPLEERWNATAKHIGVDMNLISSTAGHA